MYFRTQIPFKKKSNYPIDYHSKIFLLGSCFSENIGNQLSYYKFQSTQNPFGILFHPKAIEHLIYNAVHQKKITSEAVFFHQERWHCFDAHSSLSASTANTLLTRLNTAINITFQELKHATHVMITLGSAWVYKEKTTNKLVANCHKIPQKNFLKELLSVNEIFESLTTITQLIQSINPKVAIIITVSPIRHLKDGFIENQRSKAHLLSGIHQFLDAHKNEHIRYFPSYEILIDELRDYRFYKADMLHPNSTAIQYIWEQFIHVWLSENATATLHEIESIQKRLAHQPFYPNSESHQKFMNVLEQKISALKKRFPFLKF